jgi:predicted RNase H-like nuclease (RuvC/YqgF family)
LVNALGKRDMKRLIVGVDPGVTVGLAALTLTGQPVLVESRRSWSFPDLIKAISDLGEPTVVSSDVSPAPDLLEQLSHKLNAVLFVPLFSMAADEKRQTAKEYAQLYGLKIENTHEADALAAAVKAFQHYQKKFDQVEVRVKRLDLNITVDDVKNLVAKGHTFKRAVEMLQDSKHVEAPQIVRKAVPRDEHLKDMIAELEARLAWQQQRSEALRLENRDLRAKVKVLEAEIASQKEVVEKVRSRQSAEVRREREYGLLSGELQKAKAKLSEYTAQFEEYKRHFDEMQRLRELESQGKLTLLKPIEAFTENGLEKSFQIYSIKAGDSVLLLDPSGGGATTAEELSKRGVKIVVARGFMSHQASEVFARYMIPVVAAEGLRIEWLEGLPYADSESLRKAVKEAGQTEVSKVYEEVKSILEDHRKEIADKGLS